MTYQRIPGQGMFFPSYPIRANAGAGLTTSIIDATGEKIAFIGQVFNKDRTSKDITKLGFRPGTVVSGGGSGVTISLQNVDATAGLPGQPDGTQDQTVSLLLSALTSTTWYQTAALSANRTVSFGEELAVVFEFDGSGRLGTDSLQVSGLNASNGGIQKKPFTAIFTTSWALQNLIPNVIFEFSDGSFGTFQDAFPVKTPVTIADFNSGSTPDERALRFSLPFNCKTDGGWVSIYVAGITSDFDVVLYEGTTQLASISIGAESLENASADVMMFCFGSEITLTANTVYYLAVKPTSANNINFSHFTVNDANHFQAHQGGTALYAASRTDAGAWTTSTVDRPFAGLSISSLDDGAGAGGGGGMRLAGVGGLAAG